MFARALVTFALLSSAILAAPPTVTTLSPTGGARGTTVSVTAMGTFDLWPVKVWTSTPQVTLSAENEKGKFNIQIAKDAPLGVTWLRFHDTSGASPLRPFVVGALPESNEVEPNDDVKTAQPITLPMVMNGTLVKSGDVDCYAVKLIKGQTLVASVDANRTFRSPIDSILQVISRNGVVLKQNHDTRGLDPEIVFTAPTDDTYIVRMFAFPSQPDSSIRYFGSPACVYRLTLTAGEFVDFVTPLAVQENLEATVSIHGWNLESKTRKLRPTETQLGNARPYMVLREPHPCYDLTVGAEKPLSPSFTITGRIEKAGIPSQFDIVGTTGKTIALHLESATLGLGITPVLKVLDSKGKQLLRAEPAALHGPLDATLTPPANGNYRVEVSDLLNSISQNHVYRLRVIQTEPDVDTKVATDRFTAVVGTPLDIPITLTRKGGFKDELVGFAEGLPEGVGMEAAPPAMKPDANTLTLRLVAKKEGLSGPIRIGVTKKWDEKFRRFAQSPITEFDGSTLDLWLTTSVTAPTNPPPTKKKK